MDIRGLTYDERWQDAAMRLVEQGYNIEEGEGIVTAIFRKEGEPDLYLYMPDAAKMSDRTWQPRPLKDKPQMFGVREAAEHLGCSVATIKHAIYRDKRNALVPDQRIGDLGSLLFSEETLLRWHANRPGVGAPPGEDYMHPDRLYLTNKALILGRVKRAIMAQEINLSRLIDLIQTTDKGARHDRKQLEFMARFRLDRLISMLEDAPRQEIINLLARDQEDKETDE